MREVLTVFRFTFMEALRKKAFLILTAVILVLIVGGSMLVRGISSPKTEPPAGSGEPQVEKSYTCYVIDADSVLPEGIAALEQAFPQVAFIKGDAGKLQEYQAELQEDKSKSVMVIKAGTTLPELTVYISDFMNGIPYDQVAKVLKSTYLSKAFADAGVPSEMSQLALSDIPVNTEIVGKRDLSGYVLGIVLTMLMFFSIYYYGYFIAMSVAGEKTSRVMETLVVSAKPSRILLGKCLAVGILGLLQLSLFLGTAGVCFRFLLPENLTFDGLTLSLSSLSFSSVILVLLYFILGYALFAMINSVCGATVSRAEDLQVTMAPSVLLSMASFYLAYFGSVLPNSSEGYQKVMMYLPFTSPFTMPSRLLNEQIPPGEIAISLLLLAAGLVAVSLLSMRLYTASVLHYGERIRLKDLFKLQT